MAATKAAKTPEEKKELVTKICDLCLDIPITEACKKAGTNHTSFYKWIAEDEELAEEYARARKAISYTVEQKLETIIAAVEREELKPDQARVMIDAEKWLAGKRNAPVYGDKRDVTSDGKAIKGSTIIVANQEEKDLLERI